MKIERFEVAGLAQYSYVVSDGGAAVVIDAIRDVDGYVAYAKAMGVRITHIVETHIHADFAAGSVELAQATGAELGLSAYDAGEHYEYAMAHRSLRAGDFVQVGQARLVALHTPGHTPEHLSFVMYDLGRSAVEPVALFSGDFLFVGSLGRPDLLGEEAKLGLAHALYRSLQERIAGLPAGVQVYPGHGAGSLCGAGMSERPETTLGYERATNAFFGYGESEFVERILGSVPAMPDYYPRMKVLNAAGAAVLGGVPGERGFAAEELQARLGTVTVLDVRRPEAFGGAHVPGAINIGGGQNLSLWAGWVLDPVRPIVLVGEGGDEEETRRSLIRVGLDGVLGYLEGGMAAWVGAGLEFERTTQLTVAEVEAAGTKALVVDVRSDQEWSAGHIAGARHVMLGRLPHALAELEPGARTIVVCGSGYRSSVAASLLQAAGFTDVSSMDGGMGAWMRRGLPVVSRP